MKRKTLLAAALPLLLGGCGLGWPFTQHPDPYAAEAVQQSQPLVEDCRGRFKTWLGATPVNWETGTGPIITRAEQVITIRIEAQPTSPTAIDAVQYSCQYDNGQLQAAGPVR